MGPIGFYKIIKPAVQNVTIDSLSNKVVAIDLSIWIMNFVGVSNKSKSYSSVEAHVVNGCFKRILRLWGLGVKCIIVLESYRTCSSITPELIAVLVNLFDTIKIPYMNAKGRGEELCAVLEQTGVVSAVVSDDSDCLLFGVRKLYKNLFSPTIELYDIEHIESRTGLNRKNLIAIAMFLGSKDYNGVVGVGSKIATEVVKVYNYILYYVILKKLILILLLEF